MDRQSGKAVPNTQAASPSSTTSQSHDHDAFPSDPYPRLSISTPGRILLGSLSSGFIGFALGSMQGGQMAQLRFRAEHAHKMPDTTTGWYFYHKSKNYHTMQGGIREGFRMGAKTSFWTFVALGLESTVDRYRGSSDMFSTTVATLTVAGAFSLWRKCDSSFHHSRSSLPFRSEILVASPLAERIHCQPRLVALLCGRLIILVCLCFDCSFLAFLGISWGGWCDGANSI